MMTTEEKVMYDQMVEMGIATADEINRVYTCGNWMNWMECLNTILYVKHGCRSIAQILEEED